MIDLCSEDMISDRVTFSLQRKVLKKKMLFCYHCSINMLKKLWFKKKKKSKEEAKYVCTQTCHTKELADVQRLNRLGASGGGPFKRDSHEMNVLKNWKQRMIRFKMT